MDYDYSLFKKYGSEQIVKVFYDQDKVGVYYNGSNYAAYLTMSDLQIRTRKIEILNQKIVEEIRSTIALELL